MGLGTQLSRKFTTSKLAEFSICCSCNNLKRRPSSQTWFRGRKSFSLPEVGRSGRRPLPLDRRQLIDDPASLMQSSCPWLEESFNKSFLNTDLPACLVGVFWVRSSSRSFSSTPNAKDLEMTVDSYLRGRHIAMRLLPKEMTERGLPKGDAEPSKLLYINKPLQCHTKPIKSITCHC